MSLLFIGLPETARGVRAREAMGVTSIESGCMQWLTVMVARCARPVLPVSGNDILRNSPSDRPKNSPVQRLADNAAHGARNEYTIVGVWSRQRQRWAPVRGRGQSGGGGASKRIGEREGPTLNPGTRSQSCKAGAQNTHRIMPGPARLDCLLLHARHNDSPPARSAPSSSPPSWLPVRQLQNRPQSARQTRRRVRHHHLARPRTPAPLAPRL